MKKPSFLLAATALSLACVDGRADYPSAVLSDGPAAYYRLNDLQARSAININSGSLGAAANATNDLPSGVVKSVPGALVGDPSRASFFDFSTRTEIPFNREINRPADQPFTVEAWFLPSSDQSGNGMAPIANRWTQGGPRQGWVMFQRRPSADNTSGEGGIGWNFRMYSGVDTSTALEVTSGLPFVLGKWTHMVVVYEPVGKAGVGTKLSMYIDGELANTAEWTNDSKPAYAPVTDDHDPAQAVNGQPMLSLGCYNNSNGSLNPWFGAVDEFAFYPAKLSAAQIKAHYQNATNASRATAYATLVKSDNPNVYLRLGELAPGADGLVNVGDLRASGNGTYTSEIRPGAPGALGGTSGDSTVVYHSRNGYASASIPFNEAFNPDAGVPFTFETWLKPMRDKQGGQCPINNRMIGGTGRTGWVIFQRNPNETYPAAEGLGWNFRMYSGQGTSGQDVVTGTNYEVGRWQHLVVTWEPQTDNGDPGGNGNHQYQGILTAYVDGKQVARNENALYAANRAVPEEGQGKPVGVPADLGIGAYNQASGIGSNPFEGGIDELAFYNNYVLKPEQITAHYEAGKTRNPAAPYESLVYTAGFDVNNSPDQTKERVTLPPLYLRFNEPPSATAGNSGSSGALADGVMVNGANTAAGVTGPGFAGDNAAVAIADRNFVSLNNPASLNFSGQISLEAWVKPDATQGSVARILSHGPAIQSDFASPGEAGITLAGSLLSPNEVSLRIENGSEYVLGSTDSAGFHGVRAPVGSDLGAGSWVHLVGVYDGTTWRLYRNGAQIASQADAVGAVSVPDGDWAIGSTGEGWADNFTGSIDEVAVYNKALTAGQAKAHYDAAVLVGAKTITVTTASDVPVAGQKTLAQALTEAADGDTINFNIPGAGPHYIKTPAGGYPLLTVSNLTIDGYSQPGSSPNTNPILAANNAKIKIVLDSRNGNSTLLDFAGDTPNDSTGYGDTEAAILGFYKGTGNVVRGLCLLAVPLTGANQDTSLYGVSFAKGANGHVNGCWIGVDLDGKTKPFIAPADGVTGFRYRGRDEANVVTNVILVNGVTIGVAKGSKNPRSEFNVIAGVPGIPAILEGENHRIAGNFMGVLPDGNTDYNVALVEELKGNFEGYIEIGRAGNNTVIGVDGDGVNDADERNIFGGMVPESLEGYNHAIEFYGQTPGTNIVVAGNYFGVGVDGNTRFVNAVSPLNAPGGSAVYQFGSDLDGVSDSLEGNVVYNNWPQATLSEVVGAGALQPFFSELNQTAIVSLRGNTLVNNYTPPVDPLKSDGAFMTNYYARVVANPDNGLIPTLSPSTTVQKIVGTLPKPSAAYPVASIDLYIADADGLATGKAVDAALYPNGWIQGAKHLFSGVDNGIGDKDPAVGSFEFNLDSDIVPEGTLLTVTANYSASKAGTHGAVTVTTLFSVPVAAKASGGPLKTALIKPTEALPVELPAGSVTFGAPGAMTVAGPGLVAWAAASNADQPGDVQEFAYEEITGDFDISVKVTSVTSGPVTDPVDAWASGGLQARAALNALSPSFLVNVGNPKGVNEVRTIGRATAAQNYTSFGRSYGGVDKTLPSQWIRLRRVGNWFAGYVGTDGSNWALIGQRWQEWPDKLLVGTYAFSANYNAQDQSGGKNLATVAFSNYGKTVQNDNVAPALVSAATMGKKVVGVKFSEPVASSGALVAANYTLSQGAVTAVQGGIGGDTVYLSVSGLTADTFDVTVNNVTDTAGNKLPAGSKVTGRSSAWKSTDIGLIQSGNPNVRTAGDDPYRIGQAVAVASSSTETEIEIIGGGSNAWNPGDYIHYVSGVPLAGDFEVTVEVSRNDRPANTAAWANSGLMLRESEYVAGSEYTPDGTKVAMVANTTYIEGSAPNRAGIPLWREEPGAGYGNGNPGFAWTTPIGGIKGYYLDQRAIDAAGTPDPESSPLSSRWLRIKRAGNDFTFFVSYDGREWALLDGPKTLPLSSQLIFGFSTMSDTGSGAPPNNAYGGNGFLGTDLEGQQNPSNYSVQRIRIGTNVAPRGSAPVKPSVSIQGSTVTFTGKLQEANSLNGTFTDVPGATSPYTIPLGSQVRFYRASN